MIQKTELVNFYYFLIYMQNSKISKFYDGWSIKKITTLISFFQIMLKKLAEIN
jgi:hypothetical protein